MAAQINDLFHLDGVEYSVAGISDGELFDPSLIHLEPAASSAGCYRGYQAVFGIAENRLVLRDLHVNLEVRGRSRPYGLGFPINGVDPTGPIDERDWFNNHYAGINVCLEYSGGVLLASDFIRDPYIRTGFRPAWKYRTVRELLFERGTLATSIERSKLMAAIREAFLEDRRELELQERPPRKGTREFMEAAFNRRYRL